MTFEETFKKAMGMAEPLPTLPYDPRVDGVTTSMLTTWNTCPSMARASLKGLYSPGFGKALMWGVVFHEFLDIFLNRRKNKSFEEVELIHDPVFFKTGSEEVFTRLSKQYKDADATGKESIDQAFDAMEFIIPNYFEYWKADFFGNDELIWEEIEKTFSVKIMGIPFRGKRDGMFRQKGKLWLLENKTKTRYNDDTAMKVIPRDFQVNNYLLSKYLESNEFPTGILYNVIKRPALRKKSTESWASFMKRCARDVNERRPFYFIRIQATISSKMIEQHSFKLANLISKFADWWDSPEHLDHQATNNCINVYGSCPFLTYCDSGKSDTTFLSVKEKHFSEL